MSIEDLRTELDRLIVENMDIAMEVEQLRTLVGPLFDVVEAAEGVLLNGYVQTDDPLEDALARLHKVARE